MQAQESRAMQRRESLDVICVKRNPYLVDYEEQKRLRKAANKRRNVKTRRPSGAKNKETGWSLDVIEIRSGRPMTGTATQRHSRSVSADRKRNLTAVKRRRRKQMIRRKIMAAVWILCAVMVGWLLLLKKGNASELKQYDGGQGITNTQEEHNSFSAIIQGISSEKFAKHPTWTEDFLPVNDYSRPGETLPEVKDIFVHYTANPGTSAAQNRSYFEQQKDIHEASVSAHFIIGYEGEIIQCVPLDEIAYAVQTRNYDSISIECCYKAENGSFTRETYDALISLLAWLTDVYDLDTDHILRHYDCGGKECPVYYTEHEDAWVQLKADVAIRQN